MTRERFYQIMDNPQAAGPGELESLSELTRQFPWFSLAHTLLATARHKQHAPDRIEKLMPAAIYAGDRSLLFESFTREKLQNTIAAFEEAVKDNPVEKTKEYLVTKKVEISTELLSQELPLDVPANSGAEEIGSTDSPETKGEISELEREILFEALATVMETELSQPQVSPSPDFFESEAKVEELESDYEDPFAGWLSERSTSMGYSLKKSQGAKKTDSDPLEQKKSIDELIDTFIKNEPKITPGKAEEYADKVHGANALVEDEYFVTETLAAIYARQGKTAKAKRAYKLLSLKYPEKSIYFAAQIKKIDRGEL